MDQIYYLFSGIRWQDVLDICLSTYILFRFYVLFRGTNVIRVLIAVCVLWAVGRAAFPLGLIITNWALQGVITIAAFVIIIIFRNEISSVLQTRGLKSFFWGIPRRQFHTPLDIIADSVFEMADSKIGALIVLPLKKSLENVALGGVDVRGKLSRELLVSIFMPSTPLHDGAVIIQGERLTRAGAILPLSRRQDLPPFFGTRHRAALGVTELTDALVVVVSEERGHVSLFKENRIYDLPDRASLESMLYQNVADGSAGRGGRHQGLELFFAAMISLFCVTGIWMTFSKGLETLATYEVPVEFMMPAQDMEIVSSSVSKVELLISGSRPLINTISEDRIKVKLDLSQASAGSNHLPVTRENIQLPPGIRLKKIEPSQLDVTLDMLVEKELPVQPHWTGKLPEGLVMLSAKTIPENIRVTGGGMALSSITTLFTEAISLDSLQQSGVVEVSLRQDPTSLKFRNTDKVRVHYVLDRKEG